MAGDLPAGPALSEVTAELFKSRDHPARIRLLEILADGPVAVSTLRDSRRGSAGYSGFVTALPIRRYSPAPSIAAPAQLAASPTGHTRPCR